MTESQTKPQTQVQTHTELVKKECKDVYIPTWGTVRVCTWHEWVVIIQRNGWVSIYDVSEGEVKLKAYAKTLNVEFDYENGMVMICARDLEPYKWVLHNPVVIMEGRTSWVVVMA